MNTSQSKFDIPEILAYLFHPRQDDEGLNESETLKRLSIPVDDTVHVGAAFHHCHKESPVILFFHGNGEIVSDYDDIGPIYRQNGLNFFPIDYRGYGQSQGEPSVTALLNDTKPILSFAESWLDKNGYTGKRILMGRSLGSAPALEIASTMPDRIDALVIESGFAFLMPLMKTISPLPLPPELSENDGVRNHEKIKKVSQPLLVIHGEHDHIIPFSDGNYLYTHASSDNKTLLKVENADHNSVLIQGFNDYFKAIKKLATSL